jgi:hypothetical protein
VVSKDKENQKLSVLLQQQIYVQVLEFFRFKSKQNEVNKQRHSHRQFDQSVPYNFEHNSHQNNQHRGRSFSLSEAFSSFAGGPPTACAAPLQLPAAIFDYFLPGTPQKPLAACASPP